MSDAGADVTIWIDLALLQWERAEATLRSFYEALEEKTAELGDKRHLSPEQIATTPIDKLFAGRLAELRALQSSKAKL
jgi:hypothetical protein